VNINFCKKGLRAVRARPHRETLMLTMLQFTGVRSSAGVCLWQMLGVNRETARLWIA
jgi:hypothetical protein